MKQYTIGSTVYRKKNFGKGKEAWQKATVVGAPYWTTAQNPNIVWMEVDTSDSPVWGFVDSVLTEKEFGKMFPEEAQETEQKTEEIVVYGVALSNNLGHVKQISFDHQEALEYTWGWNEEMADIANRYNVKVEDLPKMVVVSGEINWSKEESK